MKNSLSGKTVDEMTGSREALQEAAFPLAFISRLRMATDGAGVTALVGAQGCPLQCRMCLNPKAMRPADKAGVSWVTPDELCGLVRQDDLYYLATGGASRSATRTLSPPSGRSAPPDGGCMPKPVCMSRRSKSGLRRAVSTIFLWISRT